MLIAHVAANHCVTLLSDIAWIYKKKLNSFIKRIMLTWLTLSLLFVKHCHSYKKVTWKNNVEYHGTKRRLREWPYHVLKVFDDKMIVYQRIWLKFPQPIKHLLFCFPYKNCKYSLISIDFIATIYELFDN